MFLRSANWRKAIAKCRTYVDNLNSNISWVEVQDQIYNQIISIPLRSLGHSGHLLEGMRLLLAWFQVDPFSFSFEQPVLRTETLQKIYYPKYIQAKPASIYQQIHDYFQKFSRKSFIFFFGFVPLPNPYYWNLDILILDRHQMDQLSNTYTFPHCPISFMYDASGSPVFGIYWIMGKSIPHQNLLHKNLVKQVHLFLNLNNFRPREKKGSKKPENPNRLVHFPHLTAIQNLNQYWGKSFTPVLNQFESPVSHEKNSFYTPNWSLILDTRTNFTEPLDQGLLDYREKSLIRFYNARLEHLEDWNSFFEPQFNILYHLFPYKVILSTMGHTASYLRVVLYLQTNYKKRISKALYILKLWLINGIVFETFNSLLVITRIPVEFLNQEFEMQVKTFFKQVDIECSIFYEKRPNFKASDQQTVKITPLSLYTLPGSEFYVEENGNWQLPAQPFKMSFMENQQYLDHLLTKEDQKLDLP